MIENVERLVNELRAYKSEEDWLEFKINNSSPETIARNISAMANTATIRERDCAYLIWGVDDKTHELKSTSVNFNVQKVGNNDLLVWLESVLSKNASYEYAEGYVEGSRVVVLKVDAAIGQPVTCHKEAYVRVGPNTKELKDVPSLQTKLWDRLRYHKFEDQIAAAEVTKEDILRLLDCSRYFDLTGVAYPSSIDGVVHYLVEDKLVQLQDDGLYSITNLGALLLAKKLSAFDMLKRKAVRVIRHASLSRSEMRREETFDGGYAIVFKNVLLYIMALIPARAEIKGAYRGAWTAIPEVAIRESLANAMIHQDFSIAGGQLLVEVFDNRVEITNPGLMLIDSKRVIDNPPRSRNERISDVMRRMHICEELGSGWDKIELACELALVQSPRIDVYDDFTRVTLFNQTVFDNIPPESRLWSGYLHACIQYVNHNHLTNASVRARFGLDNSQKVKASRLIGGLLEKNLIKPFDPEAAPKLMSYIPYWA